MHGLYTGAQSRALDAHAIRRAGVPGAALMELAGAAVARAVRAAPAGCRRVLVLAGAGNNGGDGYVAARWLRAWGIDVHVLCLSDPRKLRADAAWAYRSWVNVGGACEYVDPAAGRGSVRRVGAAARAADVIVDAVLGTGLTAAVRKPLAAVLAAVARAAAATGAYVLAVDVPSGAVADDGTVPGVALPANVTLTMGADKLGLHVWPAAGLVGQVHVVDLGFDPAAADIQAQGYLLDAQAARRCRARDGHKGTFGTVVALAGSDAMPGAAALVARAALRAGAGKVAVAAPPGAMARLDAEAVGRPLAPWDRVTEQQIAAAIADAAAVVCGPGLGAGADAGRVARAACRATVPVVLDADALRRDVFRDAVGAHVVLTPHPGEAARLLGTTSAKIQERRLEAVRTLAQRTGAVVVLKGAGTLIAAGDRLAVSPWATPALAAPGSGDVLAGAIAAYAAAGMAPFQAACAAVWLHGAAGATLPDGGNLAHEIADAMARVAATTAIAGA